jgi:hypothetical protein
MSCCTGHGEGQHGEVGLMLLCSVILGKIELTDAAPASEVRGNSEWMARR